MNYRHVYHAGNFADVFKHCILGLLLKSLWRKEQPYCYIDTHAGLGIYDLRSEAAEKTSEYLFGVSRVLSSASENIPPEIDFYLQALKELNSEVDGAPLTSSNIRLYPGSPFLARFLLRPQDRMILTELHPEDVLSLRDLFAKDQQVTVHHYDGYQGLKAFLPPSERRGLVLIDPAYEQKNEFILILSALEVALSRWRTGVYAIWYPIKDFTLVDNFLRSLGNMDLKYIVSEITLSKQTVSKELVGCGMVIVNPSWQIEIALEKVLSWLWRTLSPEREGGVKIKIYRGRGI